MEVAPSTTNPSLGVLLAWKRREDRPGDPEGVREPRPDGPTILSGAGAAVLPELGRARTGPADDPGLAQGA